MADVIYYLHRCRPPIIYRDLKPQNVKVFNDRIYLIDFSGALLPGIGAEAENTQVFSRGYTPPGAEKRRKIDFTYDTYSLGVVIYEMLTRYDVKSSDGKLPDIRKVRQDLSPEICEIVNKAVFPGHYWQYKTMWEMKMELQNALDSVKKLKELESAEKKNLFTYLRIAFHRFSISVLQPLLAFLFFFLIGITLTLPWLVGNIKQGGLTGMNANTGFVYLMSLYMLVTHVIWGRWFVEIPALSRLYKRFHSPISWMGNVRLISLIVIVNFIILAVFNICQLWRGSQP